MTGKVKFFNKVKGYGFITPSDSGRDIFVHQHALHTEIKENDEVSFDIERGNKGFEAVHVEVIRKGQKETSS